MKEEFRQWCWKQVCRMVCFVMLAIAFPSLKTSAGNNLSTASPFVMGNTLTGSVEGSKSSYYKFTLAENSSIRVYAKTNAHDLSVNVSLHDSTGEELDFFYTNDEKKLGISIRKLELWS